MNKEFIERKIVEESKKREKSVGFSDLVSKSDVNSPYGIGFIDGAVWMLQQFQWIDISNSDIIMPNDVVCLLRLEDGRIVRDTEDWEDLRLLVTHWLPIPEFNQKQTI